ncbi:hypothetical protein [Streptomyces bacillaris]|uniref:hypothetical protein n=1 Tax=Streptomyces bacillaris TaxID=68179 RepID=UPI003633F892
MSDPLDTAEQDVAGDGTAPMGHIRAAHRVLGWCALCPEKDSMDELLAWRDDSYMDPADEANPLLAIANAYADCRACGESESALTSVVTIRTRTGRRQVAQWAHCLACDDVPEEAADERT